MFRLVLLALGGLAGWRLAKMGESRYNFVLATITAAVIYKLTQARMASSGELAENGTRYDIENETEES